MQKTYIRSSFVPVITDTELKPYVLAVRDLPLEKKPREKMIQEGPTVLSMAELLAIIFNTGTKKEEVLGMASRVLKEYGEKSIIAEHDPQKLLWCVQRRSSLLSNSAAGFSSAILQVRKSSARQRMFSTIPKTCTIFLKNTCVEFT